MGPPKRRRCRCRRTDTTNYHLGGETHRAAEFSYFEWRGAIRAITFIVYRTSYSRLFGVWRENSALPGDLSSVLVFTHAICGVLDIVHRPINGAAPSRNIQIGRGATWGEFRRWISRTTIPSVYNGVIRTPSGFFQRARRH